VLPVFVDCHIHFIDGSFQFGRVNLEGAKYPSDIARKRFREYAAEHPGDDWIRAADGLRLSARGAAAQERRGRNLPHRPVFLKAIRAYVLGEIQSAPMPGSPARLKIRPRHDRFATRNSEATGGAKKGIRGESGLDDHSKPFSR